MKLYKDTAKKAEIVNEICYFDMKMNGLVFQRGYNVIKRRHELSKIQKNQLFKKFETCGKKTFFASV